MAKEECILNLETMQEIVAGPLPIPVKELGVEKVTALENIYSKLEKTAWHLKSIVGT